MKKFTKLFLSCAAVAAVTGAIATSAMAADLTNVKYAEGSVSFDAVAAAGTTQTLLVISGTDKTDIKVEAIKQIDQQNAQISSAKVGELADGYYTVLLGGDAGEVYSGTFAVGNVGFDITIGDVDESDEIDGDDATAILRKVAKKTTLTGKVGVEYNKTEGGKLIVGDVDESDEVDGDDATAVLRKVAKKTTLTGKVGETVTVTGVATE